MRSANVFVTMKVHDQLKPVATEAAEPRILAGKISPIISHGIGPKVKKNCSFSSSQTIKYLNCLKNLDN